ncbi:MAG: S8 family serine peptidase [Balneolales bacterium]|nr:S8 family serine peptidase [Balneolales bacterium]
MQHIFTSVVSAVCIFVFMGLTAGTNLVYSQSNDTPYHDNKLIIQLSEESMPFFNRQAATLEARTAIPSIDAISEQLNVVSMRQTITTDPRYAEQHARYGLDRWYTITFASNTEVGTAIQIFSADANIKHAERAYQYEIYGNPVSDPFTAEQLLEMRGNTNSGDFPFDDPRLDDQWHYHNTGQNGGTPGADISLFDAWEIETGNSDIIVQVLDTGIDLNHPDLVDALWINPVPGPENGYIDDFHGWSHVTNSSNIQDTNGHGSHCSGTIAATNNNGVGVAGVAGGDGTSGSGVRIMTSRVFVGATGGGGFAEAIVYGADNGAVISSNSWGGGGFSQVLRDAILYFIETAGYGPDGEPSGPIQGGLVIFAAGNSNVSTPNQPVASNPEIMAIAATNMNDQRSWYSQWGPWVHMSAPGGETAFTNDPEGVLSTITNGNYQFYQGTSMATPHVSGVAALIASKFKDEGITPDEIFERLVSTTDPIDHLNPNYELGSGRLNALRALEVDSGIPPAAISDLEVAETGSTFADLNWSAPGGSEMEGTAFSYDIRYSKNPITESNFYGALRFEINSRPQSAGTDESYRISGLEHSTTYYFAVKTSDFFGNTSLISNSVSAETQGSPQVVAQPGELFAVAEEGGEDVPALLTISNEGNAAMSFSIPNVSLIEELLSRSGSVKNQTSRIQDNAPAERGLADERVGHPVLFGGGGPDEFGYIWVDSNEEGSGVQFDWFDISEIGTEVSALTGSWDNNTAIDFPFDFPFYGDSYSSARVSVNGWINFGGFTGDGFTNYQIPRSAQPSNFLAVLWDDLDMRSTGRVYTYHDQSQNRFIIQWDGVPKSFNTGSNFTFQAILGSTGTIKFQYLSLTGNLSQNTVGIENQDGSDGLQIAYNTSYLESNLAIQISSAPEWVSFSHNTGTVDAGESMDIDVIFSPEGLASGIYSDQLSIISNTVGLPSLALPIIFQIGEGSATLSLSSDELNFGDTFLNGSKLQSVSVENTGTAAANITGISTDSELFTVETEPFHLAPGQSKLVHVRFTPENDEAVAAELLLETSLENTPELIIPLSGQGVEPPVAAFLLEEESYVLITGETSSSTFSIANTGSATLDYELQFVNANAYRMLYGNKSDSPASLESFTDNFTLVAGYTRESGLLMHNYSLDAKLSEERNHSKLGALNHIRMIPGSATSAYAVNGQNEIVNINLSSGDLRNQGTISGITGELADLGIHPNTGQLYVLSTEAEKSVIYRVDGNRAIATYRAETRLNSITVLPSGAVLAGNEQNELLRFSPGDRRNTSITYTGVILPETHKIKQLSWNVALGHAVATAQSADETVFYAVQPVSGSSSVIATLSGTPDWTAISHTGGLNSSNISWIEAEPASGSVNSSATTEGLLSIDATELMPSQYDVMLMVFTNDPLQESISMPLRVEVQGEPTARGQIVHSASTNPELVDIYVNDVLFTEGLAYGEATTFRDIPAETELELLITPAGESPANAALREFLLLERGEHYTFALTGSVNEESGILLSVVHPVMLESDDPNRMAFAFLNGLDGFTEIDLSLRNQPFFAEGLSTGEHTDYLYFEADRNVFDVFDSISGNRIAIFEEDFSLIPGKSAVMVLSGGEGEVPTTDGLLQLMAVFPDGTVLMPRNATSNREGVADLPEAYSLDQNYPNPFNPTTQISYALPEASEVRLEVFNVQGQRVAILVNGQQNAGRHSVSFDAGRLSSGMYIYRIQAGNYVSTRKMMLLK